MAKVRMLLIGDDGSEKNLGEFPASILELIKNQMVIPSHVLKTQLIDLPIDKSIKIRVLNCLTRAGSLETVEDLLRTSEAMLLSGNYNGLGRKGLRALNEALMKYYGLRVGFLL